MPKSKKSKGNELRNASLQHVFVLITSAFGVVSALAWNTAIQAIFADVFGKQSGIYAMLAYALIVTLVAVVVTIYVAKVANRVADK
jgi:uncharacterized membrane protein YidH (DUF202 family)